MQPFTVAYMELQELSLRLVSPLPQIVSFHENSYNIMHKKTTVFMLNHEFTKISEVNLFASIYRLFHEDFSSIIGTNINECS